MKNLKTKLMAAISMVLISTLMLTSVSYAWYTLSTNPEVAGIKATAVANENLEIALNKALTETGADVDTRSANATAKGVQGSTTEDYYTWGNIVDVTDILNADAELRPAAANDATSKNLYTALYGNDGRISGVEDLTEAAYVTGEEGTQILYRGTSTTKYAFKVNYWLKTNVAGAISLSEAEGRADGSGLSAAGNGSYITNGSYDAGDVKLAFHITGGTVDAWVYGNDITYGTEDADGKSKVSASLFTAAADTAYLVEMYVYLDGLVVVNADADTKQDVAVNIQFDNVAISDDGAMTY